MRDYLIKNARISSSEYDTIMKYQNTIEDLTSPLSLEPKKIILFALKNFSLTPDNLSNRLKWHITKKGNWYNLGNIKFQIMHDYFKDPNLYSLNRYGKCYEKSFIYALMTNLNLAVAICKDEKNFQFLHAYLIGNLKGEEVVLDYTLNLILKKEDYYNLMDAYEISYISNPKLKELERNIHASPIKSYLDINEILIFPKRINELALKLKKE